MSRASLRAFTLIEIVICVAILAMAAAALGLQLRSMVADHTFSSNVANLVTELKKCQLIAVCDQTHIEVVIAKEAGRYAFWARTDDPLPVFLHKKMAMAGVHKIHSSKKSGKKKLVHRYVFHFHPSGRFEPVELYFSRDKKARYVLECIPSTIELKSLSV